MHDPANPIRNAEAAAAFRSALLDLAAEEGAENVLIYLSLMSTRDVNAVRSEISSLREDGKLREDRSARASATKRLRERITDRLTTEIGPKP
jgi:hypothetical protein